MSFTGHFTKNGLTSGAYDTTKFGMEAFISRLDSSLSTLSASTFLGGFSDDYATAVAVDSSGNIVVAGYTMSSGFPVTSGAYDLTHNGDFDVFLSMLDGSLTTLEASTFIGGSNEDSASAIAIDESDDVVVVGETYSMEYPVTSGAYDISYNSISQYNDVFISKLQWFGDGDGDGYTNETDCNDSDPLINPGAAEECDGVDNNCDGNIDEGFPDADDDGYLGCYDDCDDGNPSINPAAVEICDDSDNNCDGNIDEGYDIDADGYSVCQGDCDDDDPDVNPGMTEVPNCKDDDCNAATSDSTVIGYWGFMCIDSGTHSKSGSSMATDSSDNQHICYYDAVNSELKYATNASGTWVITTLGGGWDCSLALDSSDKVHMSYSLDDSTVYLTNRTGLWVYNVRSTRDGQSSSITVDSLDNVHIAYVEYSYMFDGYSVYTNTHLKYTTNADGGWNTELIDEELNYDPGYQRSLHKPSVVIDSADIVHVGYISRYWDHYMVYPDYILYHAKRVSDSWSTGSIDIGQSQAAHGVNFPLAVDSFHDIHTAYLNWVYSWDFISVMQYGEYSSGLWSFSVSDDVEFFNPDGINTSIDVGSSDNVHISFKDNMDEWDSNSKLRYLTNKSGSWVTEDVLITTDGYFSAIAADSADNVHISFSVDGGIMYATNSPLNIDNDGDGYSEKEGDCDDTNPAVHPGAVEIWYDGNDQNCDGWNDYDGDMDTYVDSAWNAEAGGSSPGTDDCDDYNPMIHPDTHWYLDGDNDTYGNPAISLDQCLQPTGYVLDDTDCNDNDPAIGADPLPARVVGAVTDYYGSLQDAYDVASDGDTIQCREEVFSAGLSIDMNKTVTIQGGYDCGYGTVTGTATINGNVTISSGMITLENIEVQ